MAWQYLKISLAKISDEAVTISINFNPSFSRVKFTLPIKGREKVKICTQYF
jgi:hypothetical protein